MAERKFTAPTQFPAEYVDGHGNKAVILGRGPDKQFPFIGYDAYGGVISWTEHGEVYPKQTNPYDLHVLQTRKRRRTTMDVKETLTGVLQTNAAIEIMNEIVLHALQSSRDTCAEMLEQIEAKRDRKGLWSSAEAQDWESLVEDIGALNRVIDYYGGYDD